MAPPAKLDTHGLPVKVALALQKHSVVVVSLSSPGADVDQLAAAEAKAGAAARHAGFVNLDVAHQRPGIAVLHKLGDRRHAGRPRGQAAAASTPIFKGFVDRNVVEQAVADAR